MTTHPITLTTDQIREALAGRLTQIRMPVEPQPADMTTHPVMFTDGMRFATEEDWVPCPWGVVGDRLFVRESFMVQPTPGCSMGEAMRGSKLSVYYRDETRRDVNNDATVYFVGGHIHAMRSDYNPDMYGRWRGANLMKEWASRITLELTGVRVERLADMTEADAYRCGVEIPSHLRFSSGGNLHLRNEARYVYEQAWTAQHGERYPWASTWAWVGDVRRVEQGEV